MFFVSPRRGPQTQPKKSAARALIVQLRKQNHSVYEISQALREHHCPLSPTGVREVLKTEGFAPLPRRLDEERPRRPGPTVEPVADVREFSLAPRQFTTRCGGLFLFVADLVRLGTEKLAGTAGFPGSHMIPAEHALRACLALKLWSIERKSHVMAWVADEGLALFAGLNAFPKKSYLCEYSSRIDHQKTTRFLAAWHEQILGTELLPGESFNLDFHSVPYYGEHPVVERHYVSMRSRRQPSILAFLAQDAGTHVFCYANADLRKGEEPQEIFEFIAFWKRTHGQLPRHLVFDSKLTTYANLVRLDQMGIPFITLRRRSPKLLQEVYSLPRSAWRTIDLEVPTRKYRTPRVFAQAIALAGGRFRQLFVQDLGHDEPTILLTNQRGKVIQGAGHKIKKVIALAAGIWLAVGMKKPRWKAPPSFPVAYYHCISRVVDKQMVFGEEERERFVKFMREYERFCGVRVITYCVMSNHFHILLEVPERPKERVSDEALVELLNGLSGMSTGKMVGEKILWLRKNGADEAAEVWRQRVMSVMWDVSGFMKLLKQRFTQWYNRGKGRQGTLWEARFKSVLVEGAGDVLATMAAYIDLNPVRAGLVEDPKEYRWCGYGEAVSGSRVAQTGLELVMSGASRGDVSGMEALRQYRVWLFGRGEESGMAAEGQVVKKGFSREAVLKVVEEKGRLPLSEYLRLRVRYFADGAVLGTRGFVNDVFSAMRDRFGPKRKDGARRMKGLESKLYSMRALRIRPLS